jgi:hypothetical protein
MAQGSGSYRAAGALFNGCQGTEFEEFPSLLEYPRLFFKESGVLSCLGIPDWQSLLVYQWHYLPGEVSFKLGSKNGSLQKMQSLCLFREQVVNPLGRQGEGTMKTETIP